MDVDRYMYVWIYGRYRRQTYLLFYHLVFAGYARSPNESLCIDCWLLKKACLKAPKATINNNKSVQWITSMQTQTWISLCSSSATLSSSFLCVSSVLGTAAFLQHQPAAVIHAGCTQWKCQTTLSRNSQLELIIIIIIIIIIMFVY